MRHTATRARGRRRWLGRRDDIIDTHNHRGNLNSRANRMFLHLNRLQNTLLPHIHNLTSEYVNTAPDTLRLMSSPQPDENVDLIQARIVRESTRNNLQRLSERLNRQLLPS